MNRRRKNPLLTRALKRVSAPTQKSPNRVPEEDDDHCKAPLLREESMDACEESAHDSALLSSLRRAYATLTKKTETPRYTLLSRSGKECDSEQDCGSIRPGSSASQRARKYSADPYFGLTLEQILADRERRQSIAFDDFVPREKLADKIPVSKVRRTWRRCRGRNYDY